MNFANYSLVLLAFLGFRLGFGISVIFFLFCQPALVFANFYFSQKVWQLSLLSVHLLISTIIANMASTQLFYTFISSDPETLLVGQLEVQVGIVYVAVLSAIAIIVKSVKIVYNKRKHNKESII